YEARLHRADRADLEGRARVRCHRDPALSVWGVVVGAGVEGRARREYGDWGLRARACDRVASRRDIYSRSLRDAVPQSPSPSPEPPVPRDQVADGRDVLSVA